jgi:hypothetical protein
MAEAEEAEVEGTATLTSVVLLTKEEAGMDLAHKFLFIRNKIK